MCYEFDAFFERARARELRKRTKREQAPEKQPAPRAQDEPAQPVETAPKPRETVPV